ncbi:hypothetical protein [Actinomadura sp. NPDC000929]|uniref:hypothetical protein n=1 Tax=Actinomadura sp. NPDC000929 TaxID=3154517 RepID=UPI003394D80F
MEYQLTFFARATGQTTGAEAMEHVLNAVLESGPPLVGEYLGPPEPRPGEWSGPEADAVRSFRLATATEDMRPAADYLLLEIHVGMQFIAEDVIAADPDDDHGVWGSDLMARVTVSGERPDWPLVERIGTTLENLWSAVPWNKTSGFKVAAPPRGSLPHDQYTTP